MILVEEAGGRCSLTYIRPSSLMVVKKNDALLAAVSPRIVARNSSQFHKSSQLLIRTRNETLSVVAVRVNDPDRLPFGIHG